MILRNPITLIFCLFVSVSLNAAEYQSHHLQDNTLALQTTEGLVRITAVSGSAFEVLYEHNSAKQLPSFALVPQTEKPYTSLSISAEHIEYSSTGITARVRLSPFNISFFSQGKLLLEEEVGGFQTNTIKGFRFKLQDNEKLMGGGQRVLGMDRRGRRFPLYNRAHYGYTTESNQMYFGLPAIVSNRKYALVFDNSAKGNMDLGHNDINVMQFDAVSGRAAYIVVAGQNYPQIIENLTQITGRQPLPPRWAFGNYASRFGYRTELEARNTVQGFLDKDFPLDAIVLDLYWFGPDIKGHMGNLDWDYNAFPTPKEMIDDFKAKGVETILITEPFILTTSKKWLDAKNEDALAIDLANKPKRFDFYFGNTGLVDVFSQKGQSWFSQQYDRLSKFGVSGWWGDLGEPEVHPYDLIHQFEGQKYTADELHNVYGHKWAELVFSQQRKNKPNTRPFNLMRSGFIGSQRYGMVPWTGDVSRSWGGLKPQVELSLQMSMLGLSYTHSDLGGFAGGEKFDKELYIRWLQYGVFQPIYRPHAHESIAPEPIFHDVETQDIVRRYIKLRYQMLPYNYNLAYQNSLSGIPLMRPMVFEDENNPSYFDNAEQYFWGDALLIKPITDANIQTVSVDLPKGVWFDFWDDSKFKGKQQLVVKTDIERLPVFVRAGAFIPMVDSLQHTKQYKSDKLTMHYYHDETVNNSNYTMYDDDGINPNAIQERQFQKLKFKASTNSRQLVLGFDSQGGFFNAPESRLFNFKIHNFSTGDEPLNVSINDKNGQTLLSEVMSVEQNLLNTYYFDKSSKMLHIEVKSGKKFTLSIV